MEAKLKNSLFYSQHFEDVLLARCFSNITDGFYVDVGAQDEEACSVTRYFYDRGWSGINIEPVAEFAETFKSRERDITICCAVGSEEKVIPMSVSLDSGLSSFNSENAENIKRLGYLIEQRDIQVTRLNSIFEKLGLEQKTFEFLKVDVEGYELNVIMGIDLFRYRPKIILCEVTAPNTSTKTNDYLDLCHAIESYGYKKLNFDGLNQWWCTSENMDELAQRLMLPPGALDPGLITPYEGASAQKKIQKLEEKIQKSEEELGETTLKLNAIYSSSINKLIRALRNTRSVLKRRGSG